MNTEAWNADSKANMHVILLLRAICAECSEYRGALPAELIENCTAAVRSDWKYLQSRYPDPEIVIEKIK